MSGRNGLDHDEDDDVAAARWVLAIDAGLAPERVEAFHAWLAERPERAELIARHSALPSMARQTAKASLSVDRPRRAFLVGGAIATGAIAFGGAALMVRAPWLDTSDTYETASGEVRAVELPDTSRLWLDAKTRVSAHMTRSRRDVTLSAGRLFVEVAHDAERPFHVRGEHFEARALGTAFESTVFADRTGVAVTEGVVRLTARTGGKTLDLAAGQCAWISRSGEITQAPASARSIAAWRERRMVLSDRRLDAALAELSRYFDRPLVVADKQLAARRISFSFSIADLSAEDAARVIGEVVGADVADRANEGILLSPAERGGDATRQPQTSPR